MAFTGDLEHLPISDVIQLVHTTRKSGIFSVSSPKGESKLVFSNGYIVGANHLNDTVRIGSVLVKMGAISVDDLQQALAVTQDHVPLLVTLLKTGKLKREDALRGLKKMVEMTIVELMSWTKGTFTFDTESQVFSPTGGDPDDSELEVVVDAQMVLMDALRIFDERERDQSNGKKVASFDALYPDVLPGEGAGWAKGSAITADDLGLADLDKLEKKIPRPASEMETFDPVAIHRQEMQGLLAGFSSAEQEAFVSFLKKKAVRKASPEIAAQQAGKAVVIFSGDELIRHSVMTICQEEGIPVFGTDDDKDLERIISQCLATMRMPVVVFDGPLRSGNAFTEKKVLSMRTAVMKKYSAVPVLQFASVDDADFFLQSYSDGVRAVFPKPLREVHRETYIHDTMQFLDTFKTYIKSFQHRVEAKDRHVKELKDNIKMLREVTTPSDAAMVMLAFVADWFERAVTFFVRPDELIGERSVGVNTDKSVGPIRADRYRISLAEPSVFGNVLEKGQAFYGESGDEALNGFFREIGRPFSPAVVLVPVICDRKPIAVVYGDFGKKEASPVQLDILEILALQVGIVLEYALYRRQAAKTPPAP